MNTAFLESLGWNETFQSALIDLNSNFDTIEVGRVIGQSKGHYQVLAGPDLIVRAAVSSRFHIGPDATARFPTVGDWVVLTAFDGQQEATIEDVLSRQSLIQRRRSGRRSTEMQLIAANVDHMLVVSSMNEDFDLPRISRYCSLARDSACQAAVLLTKSDLATDPNDYLGRVLEVDPDVEVFAVTQTDPSTLEAIEKYFAAGLTTVLVGSSGVGKSTLTNWLIGTDVQKTQELSSASRGKHTTTTRDLRITRFGGLVIDTPGMQEIAEQHLSASGKAEFDDLDQLALTCRFTDCQHGSAPGCAITIAASGGQISTERLRAFLKNLRGSRPQSPRRSRI